MQFANLLGFPLKSVCFIRPSFFEARAYFFIDILTEDGYNKNRCSNNAKYMYCEADPNDRFMC